MVKSDIRDGKFYCLPPEKENTVIKIPQIILFTLL